MQLPERTLQRLDFALVINLLSLGQLERFQHDFHFIECAFQLLDDLCHLLDRLADRRGARDGAVFPGVPFFESGRRPGFRGRFNARPRKGSWFATPGMPPASAPRPAGPGSGCRLSLSGSRLWLFVGNHGITLPSPSGIAKE